MILYIYYVSERKRKKCIGRNAIGMLRRTAIMDGEVTGSSPEYIIQEPIDNFGVMFLIFVTFNFLWPVPNFSICKVCDCHKPV